MSESAGLAMICGFFAFRLVDESPMCKILKISDFN
jgi:hypothetical protein